MTCVHACVFLQGKLIACLFFLSFSVGSLLAGRDTLGRSACFFLIGSKLKYILVIHLY